MPYYKDTTNKVHFIESADFVYLLPSGSVEITQAEAEALTASPPPAIIQSVTMRQARLQLLAIGKLADIEAAIASMGDAAKITWEFSSVVERNNPLVAPMQVLFGWTDEQMDELFVAASLL